MLEGEALDEMESFAYLGSIVDNTAGTEADVRARIGKARAAFQQLKNIWRSSLLGTSTKISIFNTIACIALWNRNLENHRRHYEKNLDLH